MTNDIDALCERILDGKVVADRITPAQLAELATALGGQLSSPAQLVVGCRGDEATAWLVGAPLVTLTVATKPPRELTRDDFAFIDGMGAKLIGFGKPKESWLAFIARVVSTKVRVGVLLSCSLFGFLAGAYFDTAAVVDLATVLLTLQAVTVSLFSAFVAPSDAARQSAFVISGRYRTWMRSDVRIAQTGYGGLAASGVLLFAAHIATPPYFMLIITLTTTLALVLCSLCAYLLIGYHLTRTSETVELEAMQAHVSDLQRSRMREMGGPPQVESRIVRQ